MLEAVLLLVGVIAGAVLGVTAFTGGLEPAKIALAGARGTTSPAPGESLPSPTNSETPALPGVQVNFSGAESNLIQSSDPCKIELRFHWTLEASSNVSPGETAVIRTTGPGLKESYNRPVTSGGIDLRIPITVTGSSKWVATVATVGGRGAFPTPLELSVTSDIC